VKARSDRLAIPPGEDLSDKSLHIRSFGLPMQAPTQAQHAGISLCRHAARLSSISNHHNVISASF
jgi:hypothetical protein